MNALSSGDRRRSIFFALIVLIAFSANAFGQVVRSVAEKCFPSVFMIVVLDEHGQPKALGSGFCVGERTIASNFHVIAGASGGYIRLIGEKRKFEIKGIIAADETNDLVLLSVDVGEAKPLTLGDGNKISVGDDVYAIGNPRGLEGTLSSGIVSSIRHTDAGRLIQITAPISPGSSGGPLLNNAGEVVGVTAATFKGGQNLNFAVPVECLASLLKSKKPPVPLKTAGEMKAPAILFKDLGEESVKGVTTRHFEWGPDLRSFKFSVLNGTQSFIKNAQFLVVFYDDSHVPIEFSLVELPDLIPPGLAKWTSYTSVDESTGRECCPYYKDASKSDWQKAKPGSYDIRVLNFDIVDQ